MHILSTERALRIYTQCFYRTSPTGWLFHLAPCIEMRAKNCGQPGHLIGRCRRLLPVQRLTHYELARLWVRSMMRTAYTIVCLWAECTPHLGFVLRKMYASIFISHEICSRCISTSFRWEFYRFLEFLKRKNIFFAYLDMKIHESRLLKLIHRPNWINFVNGLFFKPNWKWASTATSGGVLIVYCLNLNSMHFIHVYARQLSKAASLRVYAWVFVVCICVLACVRNSYCCLYILCVASSYWVSVFRFFVSLGYAYTQC